MEVQRWPRLLTLIGLGLALLCERALSLRKFFILILILPMMFEAIAVGEAYGARFTVSVEERLGMARKLGSAKIRSK